MSYIESLDKLTNAFRSLPGVGFKTAQRYAYSILNMEENDVKTFAESMLAAKQKICFCNECGSVASYDKIVGIIYLLKQEDYYYENINVWMGVSS